MLALTGRMNVSGSVIVAIPGKVMAVNKPGWVNTVAEYAMTATVLIIAKSNC
jgi:hypothetical protein